MFLIPFPLTENIKWFSFTVLEQTRKLYGIHSSFWDYIVNSLSKHIWVISEKKTNTKLQWQWRQKLNTCLHFASVHCGQTLDDEWS